MIIENKTTPGFTLIELLVVIAVIGLLASVVLVALNSSRAKARDARRRADLKQVATALEFYYNDNNRYPTASTWYGPFSMHDGTYTQASGPLGWIPNLAPQYLVSLPTDPKPLGIDTSYYYYSDGRDYKLLNFQTVETVCPVPANDAMYDPARNLGTAWGPLVPCTFAIYTAGARLW
jgi:type II secretion system protein G